MDDGDFIRGLEIARDDRLRGRRAARARGGEALRRDVADGGGVGGDMPALAGHGVRAAVNAGSVVSFVAGVSVSEKDDVLFSTQLAQRAASAMHDRYDATADWYRVYVEVLARLGWSGEGFAFTRRESSAGEFSMDKSALDVILTIATGNQLAVLVKALDVLKGLADDDGAIRVFELQAMAELSGNFQLGAVQRANNGALSLALGAFHFRTTDTRGRMLFFRWGQEQIDFWAAAQKMTLNAAHYAGLRQAVIDKLAEDAGDYIAALDIG